MPLFPARIMKTLRYSMASTLSSTSGVVATYVFRANDLFDPDFTGTGHQPMGFDQMMVSYNHFTVIKSLLKVTFRATGANTNPFMISVRQDGDSTPITVIDRIVELGGNVMDVIDQPGSSGATKMLSLGIDIAKLQGVSRSAITSDPSLQGNAAASPTEVTYYHVQIWDSNGKSVTATIDCVLEQTAWFTEPRDQTESLRRVREEKKDETFVHICCKGK